MANKHRGEITARLDGREYRLCLTLAALAELEAAFGDDDMVAMATRFENGRLSAGDAIRVIGAGLRGGGQDISDEAVAAMRADGGAGGYVAIVVNLLEATFGGGDDGPGATQTGRVASSTAPREGSPVRDPFPGTR